jgi:hypothetical protein
MLNILIYVLAFIIGFTLTLGIIGGVLWLLQKRSSKLLQIIGELFIFGIICILVLTLTIVIIKPYA